MSQIRKIHQTTQSQPTLEGAGVHLRRAFGFRGTDLFDPFLLLDDFRGEEPKDYIKGFPWHPHRGIETITYMLHGEVEHSDSVGNKGVISAGDVQWMTAGSGIFHQEMPKPAADGRMYGFQLWANLPRSEKMTAPRYQEVKADQIPVMTLENGVKIRVICGSVAGQAGPVEEVMISPVYADVEIPAGGEWVQPTLQGHTMIVYVFEGEGQFAPEAAVAGNHYLILFEDGNQIQVRAGETGVRFLYISGRPLREPVAWYGPIVMNTSEELQTAMSELRAGTFIK
jgi:redox-sensitive bicupin YhaK (pirin superfamily)